MVSKMVGCAVGPALKTLIEVLSDVRRLQPIHLYGIMKYRGISPYTVERYLKWLLEFALIEISIVREGRGRGGLVKYYKVTVKGTLLLEMFPRYKLPNRNNRRW